MKKQNQKGKPYPEFEPLSQEVREPGVAYQTATALSFEEDFERRWAKGLTPNEFLRAMFDFIDSLPWKER
ncbi:hypothetical protein AGMMS49525_05660 [Bacteroidia bacterium]|nr:hypothetical protein AGMMS49525_05660 [Bacteroidia bacterium]